MSDHFYNEELYPFQDSVLKIIAASKTPFYLTGGTLLSRFILHHRFSDDLDFFLNDDPMFLDRVKELVGVIMHHYPETKIVINEDAFVRVFVSNHEVNLKVEFINDVPYRVGLPEIDSSGLRLDTWKNILSNKITAMERDAAKDFIDILFLSLKYSFNWEEMVNHAKGKDAWVNEIRASKNLMNFDLKKIEEVIFPVNFNKEMIQKSYFETIARDLLHGLDNSLEGQKLN